MLLASGSPARSDETRASRIYPYAPIPQMSSDPYLGNPESHFDIYVIEDFLCGNCEKAELRLEETVKALSPYARIVFVEYPYPNSQNFYRYDMSFLAYEKENYFRIRKNLFEVGKKTKSPNIADISLVAAENQTTYRPLSEQEVVAWTRYWNEIIAAFDVRQIPSIVLFNRYSGKFDVLVGERFIHRPLITGRMNEIY